MNQEKSRVKNSKRNVIMGIATQIITILFSFLTRTFFIKKLGVEYLGLSGLFTNILSILSIADLGFDTAIIYSMYKPIANGDKDKVAGLMRFFKNVYCIMGGIVLGLGLLFLPFLPLIVNTETVSMGEVYVLYLLFLANTVLTYLLANRVAIINADQKMYVVKRYTAIFKTMMSVLQIVSLCIFKSFIIYLVIQLVSTFAMNLYGALKARKMYPFIKEKKEISKQEKKEIYQNVRSMIIYKIGGVILSNTDNILISIIISTQTVGIYDNYNTIMSAITSLTSIFFSSMTASVGNLNATTSEDKKEEVYLRLEFLSTIIYGFCSMCLVSLSSDLIGLLWGRELVSDITIPIAIIINFEMVGLLFPIRLFRETSGLFKEIKYIFIWTSAINLILSVTLGNLLSPFGLSLFGIIIATAVARLLTTFWFEPYKLYKYVFKKKAKDYYLRRIKDVVYFAVLLAANVLLFGTYKAESIASFVIKIAIVALFNAILFYLIYCRRKECRYFKELILKHRP